MKERTYSEDEMSAMLELAAKLQSKAARNTERKSGLTLTELETIAAEAGLDPIHLRQAASELYEPDVSISHKSSSTNASNNFVDHWVVAELTDESWEEVVSELQHRYESDLGQMMSGGDEKYGKGQESQMGRSRQWKHMSVSGIETRVIIQPRGESLQVKLSQRVGWGSTLAESLLYGMTGAAILGFIGGAIADSGMLGVITAMMSMAMLVPLISYADKKWRAKKHVELEQLADRLGGILAGHPPQKEPDMSYEDADPSRIDASLLDQEDTYEDVERSKRRERN